MKQIIIFLVLIILAVSVNSQSPPLKPNNFTERYVLVNLGASGNWDEQIANEKIDIAIDAMEQGHALGYNGVTPLCWWGMNVTPTITQRLQRFIQRAEDLNMEIVPWLISQNIGTFKYSDGSNPREGYPVKDAVFKIQPGTSIAKIVPDTNVKVEDPGLEIDCYDATTCDSQSENGAWSIGSTSVYVDTVEKRSGNQSLRIDNPAEGNAKIKQDVDVIPFRVYELSAYFKTENWSSSNILGFNITGLDALQGKKHELVRQMYCDNINPTQDWTECKLRFNSLGNSRIMIHLAAQGSGNTGIVWIDDINFSESGLHPNPFENVIKESMPFRVTSLDGSIVYAEESDYVIDYENEGLYIPAGSQINENTELKVSYFILPIGKHKSVAAACYDKFFDEIARYRIQQIADLFPGHKYVVPYDEWHYGGWDPYCNTQERFQHSDGSFSSGRYMAYVLDRTQQIVKDVDPDAKIYVLDSSLIGWGDTFVSKRGWNGNRDDNDGVFDGLHPDSTFLIHGSVKDSKLNAIRDLTEKGHNISLHIYYEDLAKIHDWMQAIEALENEGVRGINTFHYASHKYNFSDLGNVKNIIESEGRWGEAEIPVTNYGDLNDDLVVDVFDLVIIGGNFDTTVGEGHQADANGDGKCNISDLILLAQNFGNEYT